VLQWNSILVWGGNALPSSEILGLVAGFFTVFSVVPQIMRVYKLKSAREISIIYNTTMLLGILIWLVYGIVLGLVPIIIWNIIGALLIVLLLLAKLKYGR
jgi:MtN3 and saliva related transmembrane protein